MNKIKNKIITISGKSKSGKSTVIELVKEKYENQGFRIHIISIEELFRECMKEEWSKLHPDRANISFSEMQKYEDFREIVNKIVMMVNKVLIEKKGKEINRKERPNDIYIIDSMLNFKNIPESFAIGLTIGRENLEENSIDLKETKNYNLIINTSYCNMEELADIIIAGEKAYRENKKYPKNWASPACFLPLQLRRITKKRTFLGNTIESLAEDIRKNGYNTYTGVLEILEKEGNKYLLEGNHRTCGALSVGKTLLPYVVTNKDDARAKQLTLIDEGEFYMEYLYDYAETIRYYGGELGNIDQLKKFTINDLVLMKNLRDSGKLQNFCYGR